MLVTTDQHHPGTGRSKVFFGYIWRAFLCEFWGPLWFVGMQDLSGNFFHRTSANVLQLELLGSLVQVPQDTSHKRSSSKLPNQQSCLGKCPKFQTSHKTMVPIPRAENLKKVLPWFRPREQPCETLVLSSCRYEAIGCRWLRMVENLENFTWIPSGKQT